MEIEGKRVLVTGGALRVGCAVCLAFARRGAKLVIHCNESEAEARELCASLGGETCGHCVTRRDFSKPSSISGMIASLPPLDMLVNNASVFRRSPMLSETLEDAKSQFDINFWSPVELMKSFAMSATDGRELAVVNILDQSIDGVPSGSFSYSLSKKALADATSCAALQLAPHVRVNAVAPGPVFPPKGMESSKMEMTLKSVPLGRPVSADDIAEACVFLAANDSITGTTLFVDCGQSLCGI